MDQIRQILVELQNRIERFEKSFVIKKITIPTDGYFVPKVVSTDPASPANNETWINDVTKKLSWNDNGTIRTIAFT